MFGGAIVPFLSLFTLLAVGILALISKERTKERMRDPNAPVSTLAKDGKYGGVAFLLPPDAPMRRINVADRRFGDEPLRPAYEAV